VYCGQCGTQNNDEAGHCETCGAPLLITAGMRTCAACGANLGDHDRFCPTCGASADSVRAPASFIANDAFDEIDIDDIDITELPPWLREMAPGHVASTGHQASSQPTPDDLPEWLRDEYSGGEPAEATPPPAQSGSARGVQHQPADTFSLVSDDDLPDWLKAVGEEEIEQEPTPHPTESQPAGESRAVALVFEVPPISRAWSTHGRKIDPSRVASAQQDFSPLAPVSGRVSRQEEDDIWSKTQRFEHQPAEKPASDVEADGAQGKKRGTLRVVALVILLVFLLLLVYVFVQGV
jgi:hypothetical protein